MYKHYSAFCQRIVMYDNFSSDDSTSIAERMGIEVRTFGLEGVLDDREYLKVKNNCWKEERGISDYVIVCDADEFLYHSNMTQMLEICKEHHITLPKVRGYDLFSNQNPIETILELDFGFYSKKYSKNIIFSPDEIEEINFKMGSHEHKAIGNLRSGGYFNLLHCRNIGGVEKSILRHNLYKERLSDFNQNTKYAREYRNDSDTVRKNWYKQFSKSEKLDFTRFPFSMRNFICGISVRF